VVQLLSILASAASPTEACLACIVSLALSVLEIDMRLLAILMTLAVCSEVALIPWPRRQEAPTDLNMTAPRRSRAALRNIVAGRFVDKNLEFWASAPR
jgi:hypothetical protein